MNQATATQHAAAPELAKKRQFFLIALGVLLALQAVGLMLFVSKIDFRTPLDASGEPIIERTGEDAVQDPE